RSRPAAPAAEPAVDELAVLTAREREVLAAVAEGLTNKEIGQRLFISERTIGVHVSHIFDKLQVRTRVQASAIFLRNRPE
ncbi:response regulator transcription factor, partial [Micromonospora globispora]|uniref:response regulator transcription factor n=1 Tax=Micromonospora globispora TaxID=1450148 RepID=UPI000FBFB53D